MWSIILDLLLLFIAGSTVYFAFKRGMVRTVINALSLILSAILSLILSPVLKEYFVFPGEHSEAATYFVVFLISWIIVKIASIILDKIISALPIINTVNKAGGLIIGVLLGIFRISLYCIAVGAIISIGIRFQVEFVNDISIQDTHLFKYVYEYNPLYCLVNLILK
jgi:uncharacterized membrane protein required for colicin V production